MERIRNEMYGGKDKRLAHILFWLTNPRFTVDSVPKQVCAEDVEFALAYRNVSADINSRSALVLALTGRYLSDYEAVYSTGVPALSKILHAKGFTSRYNDVSGEFYFETSPEILEIIKNFMKE